MSVFVRSRSESKKIFVGGLPAEATDKEFAEYFAKFGEVKDAVVMVDRATSRSRGFGFITFEHEESVQVTIADQLALYSRLKKVSFSPFLECYSIPSQF